jgi:hypothetical protein
LWVVIVTGLLLMLPVGALAATGDDVGANRGGMGSSRNAAFGLTVAPDRRSTRTSSPPKPPSRRPTLRIVG